MVIAAPDMPTAERKIRKDAIPDTAEFSDTGCDLAPSCLRCPLARCRYDEPGGAQKIRLVPRDEAIRVQRAEGAKINALASEYGLSRRTVFRILAEGREG